MSKGGRVLVVGGGAAGFFGAIAAAERGAEVVLLEKGSEFLSKVRISGGGRCNVTHACFESRSLSKRYPRGERALIGAFSRFQPSDTIAWFRERGVVLKTEGDGRMFPVTDSSETIIDCLMAAARSAGVPGRPWLRIRYGAWLAALSRNTVTTISRSKVRPKRLLTLTGMRNCSSTRKACAATGSRPMARHSAYSRRANGQGMAGAHSACSGTGQQCTAHAARGSGKKRVFAQPLFRKPSPCPCPRRSIAATCTPAPSRSTASPAMTGVSTSKATSPT